jgi:hypothetical protein
MAQLDGPRSTVIFGEEHEPLLSSLPETLCLRTPVFDLLRRERYCDEITISLADVEALKRDALAIFDAYKARRRAELLSERPELRGEDDRTIRRTLSPLLKQDRLLRKCEEVVALCDDALKRRAELTFVGD